MSPRPSAVPTTRGYASRALSVELITVAHIIRTSTTTRAAEGIDTKESSHRQRRRFDHEKPAGFRKERDGRTAA